MPTPEPIRVAVVGATGYTGAELIRWLARHPHVRLTAVTSEQSAGKALADVMPSARGKVDLRLAAFDPARIAGEADVAFTALPLATSAPGVATLLDRGVRVVDLGADFRLRDPQEYARWYVPHPAPHLLAEAVYGLTEFCRPQLRAARLVANPGCYPTAALLALLPLLERGLIEAQGIVIDAKSGVTGAGKNVAAEYLFAEVDDNLRAYKIGVHRHAPEIEQQLRPHAGAKLSVIFVPHLLPIRRGILSTIYVRPRAGVGADAITRAFQERYAGERFVVLSPARAPEIRDVVGTNDCALGWTLDPRSGQLVLISVIDNLGKGAAGQAIQNFNAMLGFAEPTGLDQLAVVP
ncbi:MAG: N-acetyl-gamma-glutamyl-phosphate reductase [Deltaproteobacteria bacterium]|nr:MAG: N-acetyl-gamma-glutamyl-phosphate reductase [Deltaproteobacteria bacterium]